MLFIDVNCCVIVDLALNQFMLFLLFFALHFVKVDLRELYAGNFLSLFSRGFLCRECQNNGRSPVIPNYFHKIIHQILIENTVIAGQKVQRKLLRIYFTFSSWRKTAWKKKQKNKMKQSFRINQVMPHRLPYTS